MTAEVVRIYIKTAPLGPMEQRDSATLVVDRGIDGNADQGGRRQVTVLAIEAWNAMMAELGGSLDPSARRANVVVRGIDLAESRRKLLEIGGCRIRIHDETEPCDRMDEALPGLQESMRRDWRGGVFGEVVDGGEIRVGDRVAWVE